MSSRISSSQHRGSSDKIAKHKGVSSSSSDKHESRHRTRSRSPNGRHHHHQHRTQSHSRSGSISEDRDKDHHRSRDREHHRDSKEYRHSSSHSSKHKRQRSNSPTNDSKKETLKTKDTESQEVKKQKVEEEEFQRKVEEQMQRMKEPTEEELLEKARQRRLAIMQKYKPSDSTSVPTTPPQQTILPVEPTQETKSDTQVLPVSENRTSPESNQGSPLSSPKSPVDKTPAQVESVSSTTANAESMDSFDMFSATPVTVSPKRLTKEDWAIAAGPTELQTDKEGYVLIRAGEMLGDRYLVGATCGSGMFSKVLRAKDTSDENKEVVIKVLRDNDFMKRVGVKEVETLQRLADADPEGTYGCVHLLNNFKDREFVCLVFEPMLCNLREMIHKHGPLPFKAVQVYTKQLLHALYLLKHLELIHADLKPDNILVNEKKSLIKLSDFGSVITLLETHSMRGTNLVSGYYRAPEIILGLMFSYDIDMWSAACSIYEMVTGKILFSGGGTNTELLKNQMEVLGEIPRKVIKKGMLKHEFFDDQFNFLSLKIDPVTGTRYTQPIRITGPSRDMKAELLSMVNEDEKKQMAVLHDLLVKMLAFDASKRIKVEDALRHPFFAEQQ